MTYPSSSPFLYHKGSKLSVAFSLLIVLGQKIRKDSSETSGLEEIYFVGYGGGNFQNSAPYRRASFTNIRSKLLQQYTVENNYVNTFS
jgi:hypothetical protein